MGAVKWKPLVVYLSCSATIVYIILFTSLSGRLGEERCADVQPTSFQSYLEEEQEVIKRALIQQWEDELYPDVETYIVYSRIVGGLRPLSNLKPLRPDFGPVVNDVSSFRYPISVPACNAGHKVLVAVVSAPAYFDRRDAMRRTWINPIHLPAKVAFIMGRTDNITVQQQVEEESFNHGDILQVDMVDTYDNLTLKAVALLNWVNAHCPQALYVLKCDDDVYVNVHNLAIILRNLPPYEQAIYGLSHSILNVQRNEHDKWRASYEEWPWSSFPPYLSGGAIMISGQAIVPLLAAAQTTPYFWIDDVYLSGLLASKAGVRLRVSNQMFDESGRESIDPCFVRETITWLTSSSQEMVESHHGMEEFYSNKSHCFRSGTNTSRIVVDSILDFTFSDIQSEKKNQVH